MTLTEVQKNFTAWRETRCHSKEKIPAELWQQVASIYSSYPRSMICRRLGLSGQQIKEALQGDGFASFVPTASIPVTAMPEPSVCEFGLERGGTRLTVKVTMSDFDEVFSKLTRHMPC